MDYEKAYKEALERARQLRKDVNQTGMTTLLEEIFPELHKSEAERMIDEIIYTVTGYHPTHSTREINEMVDWLKKLKESLHISESCKENADSFTGSSEDEKIRNEILIYIGAKQDIDLDTHNRWCNWLEKQDESDMIAAAYQLGRSDERRQKPTNSYKPTYEQMEALRFAVNYLAKEYVSQSVRLSIMYDHLKEMEKQKPVEGKYYSIDSGTTAGTESTEDERIRNGLIEMLSQDPELHRDAIAYLQRESPTYKKEALRMEYEKGLADAIAERNLDNDLFREGYEIGYEDAMRVNQPVEWSEEDNIGWDEAFACVTEAEKAAKNEEELQNAVTAEKWLKEIKFKYYVHHVKQEWSEDDKMMIKCCLRAIDFYKKHAKQETPIYDLIPARFDIEGYLASADKVESWLKSLRPQKKWKPSKEQMNGLLRVEGWLRQNCCDENAKTIAELYEQLKKLMDDEK